MFSFLLSFVSFCFCLFLFLFLLVFVSSDVFIVYCISLLPCFFTVCVVTASATDLRERFLLSGIFYITLLTNNCHNLLLLRLLWGQQFSLGGCSAFQWCLKHRPDPSVCLNHSVFGNYIISGELYLNVSKYVGKLLVAKSLINFKYFS